MELDELNAAVKAEHGTAVFGINKMADLSPLKFQSRYLGATAPDEFELLSSM